MLTLEQGAKMLIVAWVKDWRLRILMDVLDEVINQPITDERIEALHKQFPFMPTHKHWYIANKGKGVNTIKFVADTYPKLSQKLFDASSNEVRLKNVPYIMKQDANNSKVQSNYSKEEYKERRDDTRNYQTAIVSYRLSRDAFKKAHRNAWEVIK